MVCNYNYNYTIILFIPRLFTVLQILLLNAHLSTQHPSELIGTLPQTV